MLESTCHNNQGGPDMSKQAGPKPVVRPYHETILGAIDRCHREGCEFSGEKRRLFILIKETAIPKGHEDEVLSALRNHFSCDGCDFHRCRDQRQAAEDSILAQKATAAQKG